MKIRMCVLSAIVALGCASASRAALINVDFNTATSPTFSGAGVLGAAGDVWNGLAGTATSGTTYSNLLTSAGTATAVSLTVTGSNLNSFSNTGGTVPANTLLQDYEYTGNAAPQTLTITLNGLTPNGTYDLVVYSAGDTAGQGATITGSITGSTTGANRSGFTNGVTYIENTTAIASGSGTLSFTATPNQSLFVPINGLQVNAAVPEPASLALLALGSLGLLARRRSL